jgi:predicted PurR-regulated permease PerM
VSVGVPSARPREESGPEPVPFPVPLDVRSVSLTGLFALAVLYTAYAARPFLVPLVLALLLAFLFNPVVRGLERLRVPRGLSAAAIVLAVVGTIAVGGYSLSGPAAAWIARAPESLSQLETKLRRLRRPVEQVTRTAERVGQLTEVAQAGPAGAKPLKVEVQRESWSAAIFGGTWSIVSSGLVVVVLLYFFLASGDVFLAKLVKVLPTLTDKKRALQIARDTERSISYYLLTTTLVNGVFGSAVAVAMHLVGMPNAVLWGVLAAVTNFIPYLGAVAMMIILGLVALVQFDETSRALLAPLVFFALNVAEGYLLTPMALGRRLTLNPVVVFVGVLFWGWIWGIAGALLAVPILAASKIVCDRIEGLAAVGEFLGP